jgi:hypothetical protein
MSTTESQEEVGPATRSHFAIKGNGNVKVTIQT